MRLVSIGVVAALLLLALLGYLLLRGQAPVHAAALVPKDAVFAVTYRSINEMRSFYDGGYRPQNREFLPARDLIGRRINVPELDGVDFGAPVVSFVRPDAAEVIVVPVRDRGALEKAFEINREAVRLRAPARIGNYASFSAAAVSASRGEDHPLVLKALDYPVGLLLRTADPAQAELFLSLAIHGRPGGPEPGGAARFLAAECLDCVAGAVSRPRAPEPGRIEVQATPAPGGALRRSGALASRIDLLSVANAFPATSLLFVAAVVAGEDAKKLGLPFPTGDAAIALGVLGPERPFDLLVAVRPRDPALLRTLDASGPSLFWTGADDPIPFEVATDGETVVRSAPLPALPERLSGLLSPDQRRPPPVFLATATEGGVWYCAAGPNAGNSVRTALACARGAAPGFGLRGNKPIALHAGMLRAGRTAIGMLSIPGARALGYALPPVEFAAMGPASAITFTLDVETSARLDLWIHP